MTSSHIALDPFQQTWAPAPGQAPIPAHIPAPARVAVSPVRTAPKVRWGRIVLMLAGASMLAIGAWTFVSAQSGGTTPDVPNAAAPATLTPLGGESDASATTVAAATATNTQGKPGSGLPDPASSESTTSAPVVPNASVDTTTPPMKGEVATSAPTKIDATTEITTPTEAPMKDPAVTGGGGAPEEVAAPTDATIAEPAAAARVADRTAPVRGGGAAELPYTGAETWIVAILGVMVLLIGVLVQINAVRIGMTAMLYRRGILLRPVDCARLARQSGILAPLRLHVSNALHYLLAEPAGADFVTAR